MPASSQYQHNNSFTPLFKKHARVDKVDVIIANHSLVMADADLGGGVDTSRTRK